jgi:hypothetical protein
LTTDPGNHDARVAKSGRALKSVTFVVAASMALIFAAPTAPIARGQSLDGRPKDVSIDELKRFYLACDRAASDGRLDTAAFMQCSIVYEELKRRAFGGDFGKLLAWWREQPAVRSVGR